MVIKLFIMKYIFRITLVLLIITSCKTKSKQQTNTLTISESNVVERIIQKKDSAKFKTAIGKTYDKYLNEINEFKGYYSDGWHSISGDNSDDRYSSYGLKTLDIYEENKEEGTREYKSDKYVVMLNSKTVVDYIDVSKINKPKDYVLCDEILLNNKIDRELFGYVKYDDSGNQFVKDFYKVFRADKETGKILEIPITENMKVENGDYGF